MVKIGDFFQYDDSSLYIWRSGDENDPFVDQSDTVKVINNRGILVEIPDRKTKVKSYLLPVNHSFTEAQLKSLSFLEEEPTIEKLYEIDTKIYNAPKTPAKNQFIVNYATGILTFHPSLNARDVVCVYKGVGRILLTAERVWLHSPNPWTVDTLQGFVDLIFTKEAELNNKFTEFSLLVDNKTSEILNKVDLFTQFLQDKTEEYEHYIDGWIARADEKIDEVDETLDEARLVISASRIATENCIEATQESIETTLNSRLVWQPDIPSYLYVNEIYPFPELGWTTICADNGDVIRFNGSAWVKIGNIVGAVPLATNTRNGLMSSIDKFKLDGIKPGAEPNLKGNELKEAIPTELKIKSIIFTIPNEVRTGDVGYILQAPFEGRITRVTAYSQSPSISGEWAEFMILKSPLNRLNSNDGWEEITDRYNRIRFLGNSRVAEPPQLLKYDIGRYDLFRIVCTRQGEGLAGVTVQIDYVI